MWNDPPEPDVTEQAALITPVDLRLRAGGRLESAVQPDQPVILGTRPTTVSSSTDPKLPPHRP